ncbi:hypothetical protein ACLOJK_003795 [Asimina triloba]
MEIGKKRHFNQDMGSTKAESQSDGADTSSDALGSDHVVFSEGEKVLAYHCQLFYEAKVVISFALDVSGGSSIRCSLAGGCGELQGLPVARRNDEIWGGIRSADLMGRGLCRERLRDK